MRPLYSFCPRQQRPPSTQHSVKFRWARPVPQYLGVARNHPELMRALPSPEQPRQATSSPALLLRTPLVPFPCRGDDVIQLRNVRPPLQFACRTRRVADQSCGITRPPVPLTSQAPVSPVTRSTDAITSRTE